MVLNQARILMNNIYLEKLAATRLSKEVFSKMPASDKAALPPGFGAAQLNKKFTGSTPTGNFLTGNKENFGTSKIYDGSRKVSSDSLVSGKTLRQRLADKKSGAFVKPTTKSNIPGAKPPKAAKNVTPTKGFFSKALKMARRNPVASAAVAGATAFGIGRATKSSEPQY